MPGPSVGVVSIDPPPVVEVPEVPAPMTQNLLDLGPPPSITRPSRGQLVVADRRLGRCVLVVRGVHPTAITADRIEVVARADARGESTPHARPTTIAYGDFRVVDANREDKPCSP